jgi:putative transcriptional regulator
MASGFEALADDRTGKRTLRTVEAKMMPALEIGATELLALRERLRL